MKVEERLRAFEASPALFIEEEIRRFVRESPLNRLTAFGSSPIFEEPLVGFADGDDPIFTEYKTIIADFHLTPGEALEQHLKQTMGDAAPGPSVVSAISFVLPIARATRLSNRKETQGPSLRWNNTRWQGQDFIWALSRHLVAVLEGLGYRAVAPELAAFFRMKRLPDGLGSVWSQRHIAYAAGLGTFSLSDGFITPRGIAMRCGSVVTDLKLPPSPRPYPNHLANCLFYIDRSCRRCIERCPGGAITEKGHDKEKCRLILFEDQRPWMEGAHGAGYIGQYAGCGLCQTKVPCEDRIPKRAKPSS
jgi:epoxyqueuosine reductase QueG